MKNSHIKEVIARFKKEFVKKATNWRENHGWTVDYVDSRADKLESFLRHEFHAYEEKRVDENTSDGYHTFKELYEFRKLYNAALFNEWYKAGEFDVHKSWHHNDDPEGSIFGKGWFIVMAQLPTGQISNHYPKEDWSLFNIEERKVAEKWDGHTAQDVAQRLHTFLLSHPLLNNK